MNLNNNNDDDDDDDIVQSHNINIQAKISDYGLNDILERLMALNLTDNT